MNFDFTGVVSEKRCLLPKTVSTMTETVVVIQKIIMTLKTGDEEYSKIDLGK